jgi:hypothetical protein
MRGCATRERRVVTYLVWPGPFEVVVGGPEGRSGQGGRERHETGLASWAAQCSGQSARNLVEIPL